MKTVPRRALAVVVLSLASACTAADAAPEPDAPKDVTDEGAPESNAPMATPEQAASEGAPVANAEQLSPPRWLHEVTPPSGFTFEATRAVSVEVTAAPGSLAQEIVGLEIARPDGKVLYRGPLSAARAVHAQLALPSYQQGLKLTLGAGTEHEQVVSVAVSDNSASHVFE